MQDCALAAARADQAARELGVEEARLRVRAQTAVVAREEAASAAATQAAIPSLGPCVEGLDIVLQAVMQAGAGSLAAGAVGTFTELVKRFGAALAGSCQAELQAAQAAVALAGGTGGMAYSAYGPIFALSTKINSIEQRTRGAAAPAASASFAAAPAAAAAAVPSNGAAPPLPPPSGAHVATLSPLASPIFGNAAFGGQRFALGAPSAVAALAGGLSGVRPGGGASALGFLSANTLSAGMGMLSGGPFGALGGGSTDTVGSAAALLASARQQGIPNSQLVTLAAQLHEAGTAHTQRMSGTFLHAEDWAKTVANSAATAEGALCLAAAALFASPEPQAQAAAEHLLAVAQLQGTLAALTLNVMAERLSMSDALEQMRLMNVPTSAVDPVVAVNVMRILRISASGSGGGGSGGSDSGGGGEHGRGKRAKSGGTKGTPGGQGGGGPF